MVSEVAALKKRPITLGFRYIELARWGYKLTYNWEIIATPWKKKAESCVSTMWTRWCFFKKCSRFPTCSNCSMYWGVVRFTGMYHGTMDMYHGRMGSFCNFSWGFVLWFNHFFNGHSMGFIVRYQEDRMGMSWNIHVCINNYPSGKSPFLMGKLTINHHFQ